MSNDAPPTPTENQYIKLNDYLTNTTFAIGCLTKLSALFHAIGTIVIHGSKEEKLATMGEDLADEWVDILNSQVDQYRDQLGVDDEMV